MQKSDNSTFSNKFFNRRTKTTPVYSMTNKATAESAKNDQTDRFNVTNRNTSTPDYQSSSSSRFLTVASPTASKSRHLPHQKSSESTASGASFCSSAGGYESGQSSQTGVVSGKLRRDDSLSVDKSYLNKSAGAGEETDSGTSSAGVRSLWERAISSLKKEKAGKQLKESKRSQWKSTDSTNDGLENNEEVDRDYLLLKAAATKNFALYAPSTSPTVSSGSSPKQAASPRTQSRRLASTSSCNPHQCNNTCLIPCQYQLIKSATIKQDPVAKPTLKRYKSVNTGGSYGDSTRYPS